MTDRKLYEVAYNAHEQAENAAMVALRAVLIQTSIEALACLADPQWNWTTRSFLSDCIIDHADDILTAKLDAAVQ